MEIKKQNTHIEINEYGFKLEINASRLLESLISPSSKEFLHASLINELNNTLLIDFGKIYLIAIEDPNYIEFLKENLNESVLKFAHLTRDFTPIFAEAFDEFYNSNELIMEVIYQIFRYNPLYGFKRVEKISI